LSSFFSLTFSSYLDNIFLEVIFIKVLLIQPGHKKETIGFDRMIFCEPLGLEMVASSLKDHQVRILDMRLENNLPQVLSSFRPDICGISCSYTIDVSSSLRIAGEIKSNGKGPFIVVGGHHATMMPKDFFRKEIDAIAVGEGEWAMRDLVDGLEKRGNPEEIPGLFVKREEEFSFTGTRDFAEDLDTLPFPDYEAIRKYRPNYHMGFQKPLALVETARGCSYHCNFCSVWMFYQGRCRMKSPERVISELMSLREKKILFTDDNFLVSPARAEEIAKHLKRSKMEKQFTFQARSDTIVHHPDLLAQWKEVGLRGVFIGFEKIEDDALASIDKRNTVKNNEMALEILRSLGIDVWASFIVGPNYEKEDFKRLRQYIIDHRIKTPTFSVLTPLPGTHLFEEKEKELTTKDYDLYDIAHAVLPTKLGLGEFYKEYASLWDTPYSKYGLIWEGFKALLKGRFTLPQLMRMLWSARKLSDTSFYLAHS
jgi:radical SAM superfamily enzyme YgiQ (UPF0313 family)